jgi:hypothetical protein
MFLLYPFQRLLDWHVSEDCHTGRRHAIHCRPTYKAGAVRSGPTAQCKPSSRYNTAPCQTMCFRKKMAAFCADGVLTVELPAEELIFGTVWIGSRQFMRTVDILTIFHEV